MKTFYINTLLLTSVVAVICSCRQKADVPAHTFVQPLPSGLNLDSLTDATVAAEFSVNDFNWMGGNLTFTVLSEDLYDAVQVNNLALGDTLVYSGDTIIISKIDNKDGSITINGGLENGGAYLWPYEGGTYRAVQMDDHSIYTALGKVELPLSEDFTIIDCKDDPHEPSDTICTDQKLYLENLVDYRQQFNEFNTTVQIDHGLITNITRRWIP